VCVTRFRTIGQSAMTPSHHRYPVTPGVMNLSYLRQLVGGDASVILDWRMTARKPSAVDAFSQCQNLRHSSPIRGHCRVKAHVTILASIQIAIANMKPFTTGGILRMPRRRSDPISTRLIIVSLRRPKTHQVIWPTIRKARSWCR